MSNKTTLQSNNTKLTNNNTDLTSILNTINNLPAAGGDTAAVEDSFILHTVSGDYVNNRVEKIGYGAFYEDTALTGFTGLNVTTVGDYAFRGCSKVVSLNLPKATKIGVSALYQVNVQDLILPEVTTMGTHSFGGSY